MQQSGQIEAPNAGTLAQRLLYGAAIVGGAVVATNMLFNRETREDGGMPPFERQFLNETFMHTGLGIGIIGVAAQALHKSGWSYKLMTTNPWVVLGVGLAASIGTMYGTFATSPDKYASQASPENFEGRVLTEAIATSKNMPYGLASTLPKLPYCHPSCSFSPRSSLVQVSTQ